MNTNIQCNIRKVQCMSADLLQLYAVHVSEGCFLQVLKVHVYNPLWIICEKSGYTECQSDCPIQFVACDVTHSLFPRAWHSFYGACYQAVNHSRNIKVSTFFILANILHGQLCKLKQYPMKQHISIREKQ